MTTRARKVLADCESALIDFAASANTQFQRSRWLAVITLLRTVGHVLVKVDRKHASREVQRLIDAKWKLLNDTHASPHIFHDFIDAERDYAVKEYEIGAAVNIEITPGTGSLTLGPGEAGGSPAADTTVKFVMRRGPFQGRDPRDLCREAIRFWRDYLESIDSGSAG